MNLTNTSPESTQYASLGLFNLSTEKTMAEFSSLTHKFRANVYSLQSGANKVGKRNRQPLSCIPCRLKKLKCDRGHPCETCIKKGEQSACTYGKLTPSVAAPRIEVGGGSGSGSSNGTSSGSDTANSHGKAQERLRHLEQLVMRMVDNTASSSSPTTSSNDAATTIGSEAGDSSIVKEGHLQVGASESRYVGSTHWAAILENIQELKTALGADHASGTELDESKDVEEQQDSEDLFASTAHLSLAQILAQSLPPRLQVDRRLSTYFNARYMVGPCLHAGQFQREYEQFWQAPLETSPLWIAMMFAVCCISATLSEALGFEEPIPSSSQDQRSPRTKFISAAGQCLQLGGYVRPKRYAVEALALYVQCKYMATLDPSREVGTILAILVRLAYRSGYHRDASNFAHFSVFEGEMRRRTWAMCQQCDLMTSFQMGLPNLIPPDSWDTRLPRNLLDSDFGEHTTVLPPSRREEEPTPIVYFIAKSRLMRIFGKICDRAVSFRDSSQQEIMALDAELRAVHATVPGILRNRPMAQVFADPAYLIMVRLNCEFLYQKSLCVLHRKYMTQGGGEKYPASTQACLDAATAITKHMLDVHKELQPGGQLYADRWMLSSFTMNDFYLACLVLCLGLSTWKKANPGKLLRQNARMQSVFELLKAAFAICEERSLASNEARRVTDVLRVVLGQMELESASTQQQAEQSQRQTPQQQQQQGPDQRDQQQQHSSSSTWHAGRQSSHSHGSAFIPSTYDFNLAPLTLNEEKAPSTTTTSSTHQNSSRAQLTSSQPDADISGAGTGAGAGGGGDYLAYQTSNPTIAQLSFFPFAPRNDYRNPDQDAALNRNATSSNGGNTNSDHKTSVNSSASHIAPNDHFFRSNPGYTKTNPNNDTSQPNFNQSIDSIVNTDVHMNSNTNGNGVSDVDMTPHLSSDSTIDIDWAFLDQWMALPNADPAFIPITDGSFLGLGSPSSMSMQGVTLTDGGQGGYNGA